MKDYLKQFPDEKGYFGKWGGSYVSEELQAEMNRINDAYFTLFEIAKIHNLHNYH